MSARLGERPRAFSSRSRHAGTAPGQGCIDKGCKRGHLLQLVEFFSTSQDTMCPMCPMCPYRYDSLQNVRITCQSCRLSLDSAGSRLSLTQQFHTVFDQFFRFMCHIFVHILWSTVPPPGSSSTSHWLHGHVLFPSAALHGGSRCLILDDALDPLDSFPPVFHFPWSFLISSFLPRFASFYFWNTFDAVRFYSPIIWTSSAG